jgi:hypothetical protein
MLLPPAQLSKTTQPRNCLHRICHPFYPLISDGSSEAFRRLITERRSNLEMSRGSFLSLIG